VNYIGTRGSFVAEEMCSASCQWSILGRTMLCNYKSAKLLSCSAGMIVTLHLYQRSCLERFTVDEMTLNVT